MHCLTGVAQLFFLGIADPNTVFASCGKLNPQSLQCAFKTGILGLDSISSCQHVRGRNLNSRRWDRPLVRAGPWKLHLFSKTRQFWTSCHRLDTLQHAISLITTSQKIEHKTRLLSPPVKWFLSSMWVGKPNS